MWLSDDDESITCIIAMYYVMCPNTSICVSFSYWSYFIYMLALTGTLVYVVHVLYDSVQC